MFLISSHLYEAGGEERIIQNNPLVNRMLHQYFLSPVALVVLNFQKSVKPKVNNAILLSLIYNEVFIQLGAKSQPALLSGLIRNI